MIGSVQQLVLVPQQPPFAPVPTRRAASPYFSRTTSLMSFGVFIVPDVIKEGTYMYPDMAAKEGLCSLLCVPMLVREKAIGVINTYTSKPHTFTAEDVKLMQAIANQAAISIEHTTLLEKSFEMQEALQVRKLLDRAKGYLMRSKRLSEEDAFKLIQRQSMDLRKSMREIAEAILLAGEIEERADKGRS